MKIGPPSNLGSRPLHRAERGAGASGGGFARVLEGGSKSQALSGAGRPGAIDALLAIQEAPDALSGRSRGRQRGEELLDRLDELRLALLLGRVPRERLEQLAVLLAERRAGERDPHLEQILAEIEVRAAVELAKLVR